MVSRWGKKNELRYKGGKKEGRYKEWYDDGKKKWRLNIVMTFRLVKFYFGIKAQENSIEEKPLRIIKTERSFYGMILLHYQLNHI